MEQPKNCNQEQNEYENQAAETARWETQSSQKQIEIDQSETDRYNHIDPNTLKISELNERVGLKSELFRREKEGESEKRVKTNGSFVAIEHYIETNSSNILVTSKERQSTEEDNEFIEKKKSEVYGKLEDEKDEQLLKGNQKQNQQQGFEFELKECVTCGRKFMESRLQKHSKICSKLKSKREVFNSKFKRVENPIEESNIESNAVKQVAKQSLEGRSMVSLSPIVEKNSSLPEQCRSTAATNKRSNWKITHQNFLKSIRSCKVNPNDPHGKSYHVPLQNPDYIFCKHCQRRFAPNVAEIHIPKCQHIFHRPKPPTEKKASFLKALNSLDKKDLKKTVHDTNISLAVIRHRKLEPLQITPKQSHLKSIQVAPVSKPKSSIYEQCETFAGLLKNYQNVQTRSSNYSNKQCPYCCRKFADKAAERHIPICEQLMRKNGPLKEVKEIKQAKRSESSSKLELNLPGSCQNCGFKFSRGHKYCCNCGKKRGD